MFYLAYLLDRTPHTLGKCVSGDTERQANLLKCGTEWAWGRWTFHTSIS